MRAHTKQRTATHSMALSIISPIQLCLYQSYDMKIHAQHIGGSLVHTASIWGFNNNKPNIVEWKKRKKKKKQNQQIYENNNGRNGNRFHWKERSLAYKNTLHSTAAIHFSITNRCIRNFLFQHKIKVNLFCSLLRERKERNFNSLRLIYIKFIFGEWKKRALQTVN